MTQVEKFETRIEIELKDTYNNSLDGSNAN
jgi:hypothetical protein